MRGKRQCFRNKLLNLVFCLVSTTKTLQTSAFSLRTQPYHIQNTRTAHESKSCCSKFIFSRLGTIEVSLSTDLSTKTGSVSSMLNEATKDEFRGKNVLLTGASGGLGRSLALQIAECRVGTLILSARNEADLQRVAAECQAIAPTTMITHIIPADLANPVSVEALATAALQKCNNLIHVLINNGGVSSRSRFVDTDLSVDQRCMQINFLAGAALAKAVVPGMIQDAAATQKGVVGRIIWISSVQGLVGIPNRSSYAASKFAVQGYCESIRSELCKSRVTVHCVSPGYIRTNLSVSALTGNGVTTYGVMDETTAKGADPDQVAATLLNNIVKGQTDFTVAAGFSAVAAIWMRLLCPGVLQNLLVKRYEKSILSKEKAD